MTTCEIESTGSDEDRDDWYCNVHGMHFPTRNGVPKSCPGGRAEKAEAEVEHLRKRLTTATRLIAEWLDIDNEPAAIAMHREAIIFIEAEKAAQVPKGKEGQ